MADGPRIKICGLTRPADALLADGLGVDYLGVVLSAGFARSVDPVDAGIVVAATRATRVAVLVDEDADGAERRARAIGAGVLQLHGAEDERLIEELRRRGEWRLWKSVRAREPSDVEHAVERYAGLVDALLVEGWREGVIGGGGAVLGVAPDRVRAAVPPGLGFVLAGGLTPESVADAVARFRPDVVDVSSGVEEARGVKAPDLLRAFVDAARSAPHLLHRFDTDDPVRDRRP